MNKFLEIPSKVEALKEVERLVDDLSRELHLENTLYGNILISVVEAVNNSILHGNKSDETKKVSIAINKETNHLNITIKDEGPGFNYSHIPDPTSPENIENVNGRGIFLMSKLSDNIEFQDNGSKVIIQFNI